jgi:hypothetical protein
MKSTAIPPNRPHLHLPAELPGIEPATWQAAVKFTSDQAGSTAITPDEWSCFWWHAWRPASRRWRTLLYDGGGEAFRRLREVWDRARSTEA